MFDNYNAVREVKVKSKKTIKLFPLSDIHMGAPQWKEDMFWAWIDYIKSFKSAKVIGMGDYLDVGTKNRFNSAYAQTLRNCDQKFLMEDVFRELKSKIIGIHAGNHEGRLLDYDINLTGDMCRYAKVPLLAQKAHVYIDVGGTERHILSQHGVTNARYFWTTISAVVTELRPYDFDIALYGHTHKAGEFQQDVINSGTDTRTQYFYLCGSLLDYFGGYAEDKALPPTAPKQLCITLSKNKVTYEMFKEADIL